MADCPLILSANFEKPDSHTLAVYERDGGYSALRNALSEMTPDQVRETVKDSGLRGRGGAGFPTGMKWGFVPQDTGKEIYLLVNADESEPGTFKDRFILDFDPHLMIEGAILSSYAINSGHCFIYIRGEYGWLVDRVQAAVDEAMVQVPACDAEATETQLNEWRETGDMQVVDDVDRDAFREMAEPHLRDNWSPEQVEVLDAIRSVAE